MRWVYVIQVPLEYPERWYELCRAESPEVAAELIRALLVAGGPAPAVIRVLREEAPRVPGA